MKAEYIKLVDLILSRGHYISVDTGGDEPDVDTSRNRAEILMAIESVEMAEITVYEETPDYCSGFRFIFWAMIIPFGVALMKQWQTIQTMAIGLRRLCDVQI